MKPQYDELLAQFTRGFLRNYSLACTALEIVSGQDYEDYYQPLWALFVSFTKGNVSDEMLHSRLNKVYAAVYEKVQQNVPPRMAGGGRSELAKRPASGQECIDLVKAFYI